MSWIKRLFGKTDSHPEATSEPAALPCTAENWREYLVRPATTLQVGGFRPTNELTTTVFGGVRAKLPGEEWPLFEGKPMWPICQFNLKEAPFVPEVLADIALIALFHTDTPKWEETAHANEQTQEKSFCIRTYKTLDDLEAMSSVNHGSELQPFECKWIEPRPDFPNHDCMPFDFDALDIGDFYDQKNADNIQATKLGGWPGTVQSEPWWDYRENNDDFEFCIQIEGEPKSHYYFGDGAIYIARSKKDSDLWAFNIQVT